MIEIGWMNGNIEDNNYAILITYFKLVSRNEFHTSKTDTSQCAQCSVTK